VNCTHFEKEGEELVKFSRSRQPPKKGVRLYEARVGRGERGKGLQKKKEMCWSARGIHSYFPSGRKGGNSGFWGVSKSGKGTFKNERTKQVDQLDR